MRLALGMAFSFLGILPSAAVSAAPREIRVIVALADNDHQGIVKTSRALGDGESPDTNLYWGAGYGVRTFFKKHAKARWKFVSKDQKPALPVLERLRFQRVGAADLVLVAEAYRGREIKRAVEDFFAETAAGTAALVAYVGHDGLMDFAVPEQKPAKAKASPAIVLACISRRYFGPMLKTIGSEPLLMTNGLMAPEAYTLDAAIEAWLAGGKSPQIVKAAAGAYAKYQKIGIEPATALFAP